MGYANEAAISKKCPQWRQAANKLFEDIRAYYSFTLDDLEGTTKMSKLVDEGRAYALRDGRHPSDFCDSNGGDPKAVEK